MLECYRSKADGSKQLEYNCARGVAKLICLRDLCEEDKVDKRDYVKEREMS